MTLTFQTFSAYRMLLLYQPSELILCLKHAASLEEETLNQHLKTNICCIPASDFFGKNECRSWSCSYLISLALSSLFLYRVEVLETLCSILNHFGCGVLKTFGFGYMLLHGILKRGSADYFQSINCKNILSQLQFVSRLIINYTRDLWYWNSFNFDLQSFQLYVFRVSVLHPLNCFSLAFVVLTENYLLLWGKIA